MPKNRLQVHRRVRFQRNSFRAQFDSLECRCLMANAFLEDQALSVDALTSPANGPANLVEIQFRIEGAPASCVEFSFFASNDPRFDNTDKEQPPRLVITDPAILTVGAHTIVFDGAPYRDILIDLGTPFFVTRGRVLDQSGNPSQKDDESDNDISFLGLFHESGFPLVIRGKDDKDRYADNPNDMVELLGGNTLTVRTDFLPRPVLIPTNEVPAIRVLSLGGEDSIVADASVASRMIVLGGTGDDTITGGRGNDSMIGESGDDVLGGRAGNDFLLGGDGIDTGDFSVGDAAVTANLATGRAKGQGRDQLESIENLFGSPGADRLTGNAVTNVLLGGGGSDVIRGGAGPDILGGGDGNDKLFGEEGDDVIAGDDGDDLVCGGDGNDIMQGDAGNDHMEGGRGDDELRGGDGNDLICGGDGNDEIAGNAGRDSLLGEAGSDVLLGGPDFDAILTDLADALVDLGGAARDGGRVFRG